jgi:hypothetical protein
LAFPASAATTAAAAAKTTASATTAHSESGHAVIRVVIPRIHSASWHASVVIVIVRVHADCRYVASDFLAAGHQVKGILLRSFTGHGTCRGTSAVVAFAAA